MNTEVKLVYKVRVGGVLMVVSKSDDKMKSLEVIRDIDSLARKEEVCRAIGAATGKEDARVRVKHEGVESVSD